MPVWLDIASYSKFNLCSRAHGVCFSCIAPSSGELYMSVQSHVCKVWVVCCGELLCECVYAFFVADLGRQAKWIWIGPVLPE